MIHNINQEYTERSCWSLINCK